MKYVVRFVCEEVLGALKKAGIAKGKENVIQVNLYGKKSKEIEYEGGKAVKYWTTLTCVGPTIQASAGLFADIRYVEDDEKTEVPVPEKTAAFFVPGIFREAIEAMSFENEAVIAVFEEKGGRIVGANGNNIVQFQTAPKPTLFSKVNGERITLQVNAGDFVSGVKICAGALYTATKQGFGNALGVMPCIDKNGAAMISMLATDTTNMAGMDFKALGVTGDDQETFKEKVKDIPFFMLDAGKLQAICSSGNAKKVTLMFYYSVAEDRKKPQRVDIFYGDTVYQLVTGAKCYTASMAGVMLHAYESKVCEFSCPTRSLVTACNVEAVGKAANTNPPILLTITPGQGVGVSGEQSMSRISGAEILKAPEGEEPTEIYIGIPVFLNALKTAGEKVTIGLDERGILSIQPADMRAKYCTTQKRREKEEEEEIEES